MPLVPLLAPGPGSPAWTRPPRCCEWPEPSPARGRVTFLHGAAESLPLPDASATVLWSLASIHHWPDVEGGLDEAHRVLRPGGRLLALERRTAPGANGLASHGWTDAQAAVFAGMCADHGFVDLAVDHHQRSDREVTTVLGRRGA